MFKTLSGASLLALSAALGASPAFAQAADGANKAPQAAAPQARRLKSVTVTATKRTETAQDIPVAVNALGADDLEALGVDVFTDYLQDRKSVV